MKPRSSAPLLLNKRSATILKGLLIGQAAFIVVKWLFGEPVDLSHFEIFVALQLVVFGLLTFGRILWRRRKAR